jgi:hypothetical protein
VVTFIKHRLLNILPEVGPDQTEAVLMPMAPPDLIVPIKGGLLELGFEGFREVGGLQGTARKWASFLCTTKRTICKIHITLPKKLLSGTI